MLRRKAAVLSSVTYRARGVNTQSLYRRVLWQRIEIASPIPLVA